MITMNATIVHSYAQHETTGIATTSETAKFLEREHELRMLGDPMVRVNLADPVASIEYAIRGTTTAADKTSR